MPKVSVRKKVSDKKPFSPFKTASVETTPGKFILIYGEPGVGKTTTAAHAPSPLFVTTADEKGVFEAIQAKTVPEELKENIIVLDPLFSQEAIPADSGHPGWNLLMETLEVFSGDDHDRRTLIIDTASGLQSICHQHTASMLFSGEMNNPAGFMNYHQGYIKAAEQFWNGEFLKLCNKATQSGKNIILLCHCTSKLVPNFGGSEYECYAPALRHGGKADNIYEYTMRTASLVMFFGVHTMVSTNERKKRRVAGQYGFIGVRDQGWFKAKNWYNLQDDIPMGDSPAETWKNIIKVLPIS